MKIANAILSAALMLSAVTPALAADNAKSAAMSAAWLPVQVLGVSSGCVLGIPICTVRRCTVRIHEYTVDVADKIGGHKYFPPVMFASIVGVPRGTIVGIGEGVYYGGQNAISHGVEHPFGLDSFSLGDDVEK